MTNTALDFYSLLPSLYRMRDEERRGALRALLEILQEQADHIRLNIDDLYDDFFIETCAEWVVPYIGDVVANNPLYEVTSTRRADVARTLQYRHGKGTQRVLEQLARDVTGWSAHVVPFFELLEWTHNLNHLRLTPAKPNPRSIPRLGPQAFERVGSVEIRNHEVLDRFDGPFDTIAHTVDVRPPQQASGWHNVHNTGFFLWRLFAYRLPLIQARPLTNAANEHRFHLSPAGNPIALFHAPADVREQTLTREADVEAPIRPAAFFTNLGAYYGAGTSLFLNKDGIAIPAAAICTMDLSNWARPEAGRVAVDVQRGRITFASGEEPAQGVAATYTYGFSGNLGGGPYDRLATIVDEAVHIHVPGDEATLADAVAEALSTNPARAVITIDDSRTYDESLTVPIGQTALTIQAKSTQRPAIHGDITVTGGNGRNGLTLNGLLLSGGLRLEGVLNQLRIVHSTLIPGRRLDESGAPAESHLPSIFVAPSNSELAISIERSITGAIVAPSEMLGITAKESIIDSASRDGEAQFAPALVSGVHNAMPALSSPQRKLVVTIGDLQPRTIALTNPLASLADVAARLQSAIRALPGQSTEQKQAIVVATAGTLVLLGGARTRVRVTQFANDPTATELKLVGGRETLALVGARRESIAISDDVPRIAFRHDDQPLAQAALGSTPATLAEARDVLAQAIANAAVAVSGERLLVIPNGGRIVLRPTSDDLTTVRELGLATVAAAVAGDDTGTAAGPPLVLDEVTILGALHVRQLEASNCIFDERVTVQRRQAGCVRFSYVAPRSSTPRRFRCQPETALIEPAFTSRRYGDAAYAQLALACAGEIRTGADDGSEMGAFHFLMQPQRETNLRVRLSEYLPFGLDAALIFVT
ncbi:MAG: hypothetical protein QOJ98_3015 [Acidobacteriota bacterium]|jgi:hypothetical protein|nr:hypothetical protein [Acidobacteriota bacterium]